MGRNSESADGKRLLDPNGPRLVFGVLCKPFKGMAGTTRLELATSAVTVSGLQVLSTTWKSTDGAASHWKYIIDSVIVYRHVYRGCSVNRTDRAVNFRFAGNTLSICSVIG